MFLLLNKKRSMGRSLVLEINKYSKNLKANRDWQVSKVYNLEHEFFNNEKKIEQYEANRIVRKLENHWKILITEIYPEYEREYAGETWPINKKAAAINIVTKYLYPSVTIHEVSHGIVDCFTVFHKNTIKEPGHGPFWTGVYAYNLKLILNKDIREDFKKYSIRSIPHETVQKFREYFISI